MNTMITPRSLVLLPALLIGVLASCGDTAREWSPDADLAGRRVVLFAPVDLGPLAEIYPDADLVYARNMAQRIDATVQDSRAFVGSALPDSGDPRWEAEGMLGEARGAHVVVLTRITNIERRNRPGTDDMVVVTARMVALRGDGVEVWRKTTESSYSLRLNIRAQLQPAGQPESRAAWEACRRNLTALRYWLELQPDLTVTDPADDPEEEMAPLVDVQIDSDPQNADIIVNGTFRGHTPMTVPLPVRELTLRIERQGYHPWERKITPSSAMNLSPALTPLVD